MGEHAPDMSRLDEIVLALLWVNGFRERGLERTWKSLPLESSIACTSRG